MDSSSSNSYSAIDTPSTSDQRYGEDHEDFTQSVGNDECPVLFRNPPAPKIATYAVFGGTTAMDSVLEELRNLLEENRLIVEPLIKDCTETLLELLATASFPTTRQYGQGLNVLQWLSTPDTTPSNEYLQSIAVSFPLTGLLQLVNHAILCERLHKTPGEITGSLRGITGYGHGIVVAAVLACVTDWEDFRSSLIRAETILFHIGSLAQEHTRASTTSLHLPTKNPELIKGTPSPMLHVLGLSHAQLAHQVTQLNKSLDSHLQISIAIVHASCDHVVSGPILSLYALAAELDKITANIDQDQTRIVYSKRKPSVSLRFELGSATLHSSHLTQAAKIATQRLDRLHIPPSTMRLSTYDTHTGFDLKNSQVSDLVPTLVQLVMCQACDWPKATNFADATHILDFGPSGTSGVGSLIRSSKDGTGVRIISAASLDQDTEIFQNEATVSKPWSDTYGASLEERDDGSLQIRNNMTRLMGLPPLMVAGMTPTTSSPGFVSAIMNAGYHTELAAGGFHSPKNFTQAVQALALSIPRGRGICINIIYASPKQMQWQIPLVRKLRSEGYPIDGITFGAGVPSTDAAQEYFDMGLRYLAFKPGSASAIERVVELAEANRTFNILLQWTGGRGGGHHSYEDFHGPILKLYGRIRQCPNIVLIAGSGFGGADDTYPYISGTWSMAFGRPAMPFDGILFGSRMMVAKEARTSRGAKEAIVAASGVGPEDSWEKSYTEPCGGVLTVKSEMGEPIHKLATRGVLLWKELDDTIFNIADKGKRLEKLKSMKPYLVDRLNKDYQKVWFGRNHKGDMVDLEDMTYSEVLNRLVHLLYVSKERRWLDQSYKELTIDFVKRMYGHIPDILPRELDFGLASPLEAITTICKSCHSIAETTISHRDAAYFLLACRRPGQKPPTFVAVVDEDFENWFKKDSLWQSEDLAGVVDGDAQRTCILQGPVAARYSTTLDEPVSQILDTINSSHVQKLLEDHYGHDRSLLSAKVFASWVQPSIPPGCDTYQEGIKSHYYIPTGRLDSLLPDEEKWLQLLAGRPGTWLHDAIMSRDIMQDTKSVANPIRSFLRPTHGMHVEITRSVDESLITLALHEPDSASAECPQVAVTLHKEACDFCVTFLISENRENVTLPMEFRFKHRPSMPFHPIHEIMEGRNQRMQDFFFRVWLGTGLTSSLCQSALTWTSPLFQSPIPNVTDQGQPVTSRSMDAFSESIQPRDQVTSHEIPGRTAGIDFAMMIGWVALIKTVFAPAIDGRFLNLVHLSNELELLDDSISLAIGDLVSSNAEITAIRDEAIGRVVQVRASISKAEKAVVRITSEFLFRDVYIDASVCFQKTKEQPLCMQVNTPAKAAVLASKDWISWNDTNCQLLGQDITFELECLTYFDNASNSSCTQTWGTVYDQHRRMVGTIRHQHLQKHGNPPLDYLKRNCVSEDIIQPLDYPQPLRLHGNLQFTTPSSNVPYSRASGDFNPIHTSLPFARYAGLPGTITHGMWVSAAVREQVERAAECSEQTRMRSYKITFLGMLLPGTPVRVKVTHVSMKRGLRVLSFEASNIVTDEIVVGGEAVVDQVPSAYIFTGQGSQQVGMGMELYASSAVARKVWDRADRFYWDTYGFLISDIVRHNPKQITIHFGGRRGRAIKESYMNMMLENNGRMQPVFGTITKSSTSYTFRHSDGLLFSTEFAQPALTVLGHAQYEHLRSKGLVPANALFAGHSLGEYNALSTFGQVLPFEKLLTVSFYRALIMNAAVERDDQGRSQFGMVAINPSRISSHIDTEMLRDISKKVARSTGELLEVVNYNIETQQYVATGSLKALTCLSTVLDQLSRTLPTLTASGQNIDTLDLDIIVSKAATLSTTQSSWTPLKRSVATIPLHGIDVPYHSEFLLPRMPAFRKVLETYIPSVDANRLVGKWLCNVTGKPFDVSRDSILQVFEATRSPVLADLLRKMGDE